MYPVKLRNNNIYAWKNLSVKFKQMFSGSDFWKYYAGISFVIQFTSYLKSLKALRIRM